MWGCFKHLCLKTFLMVSWGFNLVFVYFSNQGFKHSQLPHECNSQSKSAFGSHWAPPLHSWPHGPLHCTLSHEPNVKIVTTIVTHTSIIRFNISRPTLEEGLSHLHHIHKQDKYNLHIPHSFPHPAKT